MGILSTVLCIYAFIYFIHNISQSIQISKILDRVYFSAKNELQHLIENEKEGIPEFPSSKHWYEYYTDNSGYLQNIAEQNLLDICKEKNTMLHVLPVKGIFVLKGIPLFRSKKELDEETVNHILSNFNFARGELVNENYVLAFKQITEIIVKAMSPGINDPGTALNGIDYLTELFSLRMQKKDKYLISEGNKVFIKINTVNFDELLYNVMASIRNYCNHDKILIQKLLLMFHYLKIQPSYEPVLFSCLNKETNLLLQDAKETLTNPADYSKALIMAENFGLATDKKSIGF